MPNTIHDRMDFLYLEFTNWKIRLYWNFGFTCRTSCQKLLTLSQIRDCVIHYTKGIGSASFHVLVYATCCSSIMNTKLKINWVRAPQIYLLLGSFQIMEYLITKKGMSSLRNARKCNNFVYFSTIWGASCKILTVCSANSLSHIILIYFSSSTNVFCDN